jgi:hypothetical protein
MKKEDTVLDRTTKEITLKQCEAIIAEGLDAIHKVDRALSIINEMEFYREEYESFKAYRQARWNINDDIKSLNNKEKI